MAQVKKKRQQSLQQQIYVTFITENPPNEAPTVTETSSTTLKSIDAVVESHIQHIQKRLPWMSNYEVTRIDQL